MALVVIRVDSSVLEGLGVHSEADETDEALKILSKMKRYGLVSQVETCNALHLGYWMKCFTKGRTVQREDL